VSILSDIDKLTKYRDVIPDIKSPDKLIDTIRNTKDVASRYAYDLKDIPRQLKSYEDVLVDIGLFSKATDVESQAKELYESMVPEGVKTTINSAISKLGFLNFDKQSRSSKFTSYFIEDVKIDKLFNPNPRYSSSTVSQPIVSSQAVDRLDEDIENDNTTISMKIYLEGDNREERLKKLLIYRENKKIVKAVLDVVYDKVAIKDISPVKDGSNVLEIDIELESLFIATLQTTKEPIKSMEQALNKTTTDGKQGAKTYTTNDGGTYTTGEVL